MKGRALLSLMLLLTHLFSAMALLGLSGWFIAACALAGHAGVLAGFNYVVPAAVIRFLAIIRLASGYFEKYVGHLYLLDRLRDIRLDLLNTVLMGGGDVRQADSARALQQQTEQRAAWWTAVQSPLFTLATLLLGMAALFTVLFPSAQFWWWGLVAGVSLILLIYDRLNRHWMSISDDAQADYLRAQQRWLRTSVLWSMTDLNQAQADLQRLALEAGKHRRRQLNLMPTVETLLQVLGLLWTIPVITTLLPQGLTPLTVVPLMLLVSLRDWAQPGISAVAQASLTPELPLSGSASLPESQLPAVPDERPALRLRLEQFGWLRAQQQSPLMTADLTGPGLFLVTGATGTGKSSLLLALTGELDYQGEAYLGGQSLATLSSASRRQTLHLAEQSGHVFSGTLRENLTMAAPTASDDDCLHALKAAGLNDWVTPERLAQWLGDGGIPISGGERKRLLLARALLSRAPVLLLDEPLEGLDIDTQRQVLTTLRAESARRLIVMVSHIPPRGCGVTPLSNSTTGPAFAIAAISFTDDSD